MNNNDGFMLIRYDTLDDLARKVDMIETERYAGLKKRLISFVRKESEQGTERNTPPVQQAVQQPQSQQPSSIPVQQPLPQGQPQQPAQSQGQGQGDLQTIHALASQYQTVEAYLLAIDFRISDKKHPHLASYFRTEKSGNTATAYLTVYHGKDGLWGMSKWLIVEKKTTKYDISWGYPYSEIIGVVDEITGRAVIQGQ